MANKIYGFKFGNQVIYENDCESHQQLMNNRKAMIRNNVPVEDLTIYNDDYIYENYANPKLNYGSNYNNDLIDLCVNNDETLYHYILKNKARLLRMSKESIIRVLRKNCGKSWSKRDLKKVNMRFTNYAYLLYTIRNV